MKNKSILLIFMISTLMLSGCQTLKGYQYVKATTQEKEGDNISAFENYLKVAQDNDYPEAQYAVADAYLEGKGVSRDVSLAISWYKKVAQSSDATWSNMALYKLGDLYYNGSKYGVSQDREKSSLYIQQCSETGYSECQEYLSWLSDYPDVYVKLNKSDFFESSGGVAPAGIDYADNLKTQGRVREAMSIYEWHAKRGNGKAQLQLARIYYGDDYGVKDEKLYQAWAYLSAKNGVPEAQYMMGRIYYMDAPEIINDKDAKYWLELASRQGFADATNLLGVVELNPFDKNKTPDYKKSKHHFEQAIRQGSVEALVNLGDVYFKGLGVGKDEVSAERYYTDAADKGSQKAKIRLVQYFNEDVSGFQTKFEKDNNYGNGSTYSSHDEDKSLVDLFYELSPSVHSIMVWNIFHEEPIRRAEGSAVSISAKLAITNYHVVKGGDYISSIRGMAKESFTMWELLAFDEKRDLALLKQKDFELPSNKVRLYSDVKVGEKVFAIGSPGGMENTLSEGIVSGKRVLDGVKIIQTTTPITYGSSGGALFDKSGQLIGIKTSGLGSGGNINLAVSSDEIISFIGSLMD